MPWSRGRDTRWRWGAPGSTVGPPSLPSNGPPGRTFRYPALLRLCPAPPPCLESIASLPSTARTARAPGDRPLRSETLAGGRNLRETKTSTGRRTRAPGQSELPSPLRHSSATSPHSVAHLLRPVFTPSPDRANTSDSGGNLSFSPPVFETTSAAVAFPSLPL